MQPSTSPQPVHTPPIASHMPKSTCRRLGDDLDTDTFFPRPPLNTNHVHDRATAHTLPTPQRQTKTAAPLKPTLTPSAGRGHRGMRPPSPRGSHTHSSRCRWCAPRSAPAEMAYAMPVFAASAIRRSLPELPVLRRNPDLRGAAVVHTVTKPYRCYPPSYSHEGDTA